MKSWFAAIALAAVVATPALAQTPDQPDTEGGRYVLREVEDGYLRVERETGTTSLCKEGASGWTCALVADDRQAYEAEIDRLSEENAELARQIADLRDQIATLRGDEPAPGAGEPDTGAEPTEPGDTTDNEIILQLPSDEDLENLSQTFETVMRRFVEMLRSLKADLEQQDQPGQEN